MERPRTSRWKQEHRQVAQFLAQPKVDFLRTTHGGARDADPLVHRSGQRLQTLLPQSYTATAPARPRSARISRILIWRMHCAGWTRRQSTMEFYTWDEMEKEVLSDTIARKIISGDKAMVAQVFLAKGAIVPEHHHESEQITYILEGALKFEIGGREIVVGKGQVLRIPCNVPHRAVALEDTLDLDIFSPIREDWLKKDDAYLRG